MRVKGLNLLYVMAAPAEFGAHLAARISPLMIGVGPVEAGSIWGRIWEPPPLAALCPTL